MTKNMGYRFPRAWTIENENVNSIVLIGFIHLDSKQANTFIIFQFVGCKFVNDCFHDL